jgi:hypothetical protein
MATQHHLRQWRRKAARDEKRAATCAAMLSVTCFLFWP